MPAIVKLQKISRVFGLSEATTLALNQVDLTINQGEFVAIMGPSGSGKTTLLNIIGLLDSPSQGRYQLGGQEVGGLSNFQRARYRQEKMGFIFQNFNLLPNMTIIENVGLPLTYSPKRVANIPKRAGRMLKRLGIHHKDLFYPYQLSGGQIQRVAIARALINKPSIIIADEPTGNLDTAASQIIMNFLSNINEKGNTVIMVTHNPELTRYTNRVIYLQDGQIRIDQKLKDNQQADINKIQKAIKRQESKKKTKGKKK